ncbi:transposase family protein [Kaistella sp.]|uniref:transposase family protein n=1 Tax=Kaistella sp. TaxID=2782235 RepID=UPI003C50E2AF
MNSSVDFKDIFNQIEEYRSHINKLHNLEDILLIGIIGVISDAETWDQMFLVCKIKRDF